MFALCCYAENAAGEGRATGINERRSGSAKGAGANVQHRRGSNRRRKGGAQKGIKKQERPGGAFLCDFPAGKFPVAVIFRLRLFSGGSFGFPDDVIGHFGKITHNGKCQR